ncbi:two-component response regulator [Chondrocystis sp. NIES-4102]|nr:two-component response regulator [Chondrocystis sp. NIES-4102]
MIRILIVDDQSIVREGLSSLLQTQPDLEVVGEAANGQEAVERSLDLQPDVILMDIRMPIMDGLAAIRLLVKQAPAIKILVLTTFDDEEYITQAIANGAQGYLLKDTPSAELSQAIRLVNKGYSQMGPGLLAKAVASDVSHDVEKSELISQQLAQLTAREKEVLQLIATGYSNKEISAQLYIVERTVKNHVNSILHALNLRDRTQAAIFAHKYWHEIFK